MLEEAIPEEGSAPGSVAEADIGSRKDSPIMDQYAEASGSPPPEMSGEVTAQNIQILIKSIRRSESESQIKL